MFDSPPDDPGSNPGQALFQEAKKNLHYVVEIPKFVVYRHTITISLVDKAHTSCRGDPGSNPGLDHFSASGPSGPVVLQK